MWAALSTAADLIRTTDDGYAISTTIGGVDFSVGNRPNPDGTLGTDFGASLEVGNGTRIGHALSLESDGTATASLHASNGIDGFRGGLTATPDGDTIASVEGKHGETAMYGAFRQGRKQRNSCKGRVTTPVPGTPLYLAGDIEIDDEGLTVAGRIGHTKRRREPRTTCKKSSTSASGNRGHKQRH